MVPIRYQVVGEEDYALVISVLADGSYRVSSGTYTSEPPRGGMLDSSMQMRLTDAIRELGVPQPHEAPEDAADAFRARLTIGEGSDELVYPFWEGAMEEDDKLRELIRLLEEL